MFATIVIILLIGLVGFFGFIIYRLQEQNEQYEEAVNMFVGWYNEFIPRLDEAYQKMEAVDKRGSFSSDDEIGHAFIVVRDCIEELAKMGEEYDGQTDSTEED